MAQEVRTSSAKSDNLWWKLFSDLHMYTHSTNTIKLFEKLKKKRERLRCNHSGTGRTGGCIKFYFGHIVKLKTTENNQKGVPDNK